jgi:protein-S-isoprenylcysteine O-methyltransferase Ste14
MLAASPTGLLVHVGNAACWGAFVVVWVATAVYERPRAPRRRARSTDGLAIRFAAIVPCAALVLVALRYADGLAVDALWLRVVGLVVLVASTAFSFWARFALGTMWSVEAVVRERHELRTQGPYAITRNPIYTGMLGMFLGSTLLGGIGRWVFLVPLGLVVLGLKARQEERLMAAAFPDEYPDYRQRVPALVPRLRRTAPRRTRRP